MNSALPLPDREAAGRLLAARLQHLRNSDPVVLALPRGGVPVGFEIARSLDAELGLVMVRKLCAPGHSEFAIGAVIDGDEPQVILNEDVMQIFAPDPHYIKVELDRQLVELERRRQAYLGRKKQPRIGGRTAIVVDDGIATGSTVTEALIGVRQARPEQLILAVPVAPRDTIAKLRHLCDEVIALATPEPFYAVGRHYRDFHQVDDQDVIQMLEAANGWCRNGSRE